MQMMIESFHDNKKERSVMKLLSFFIQKYDI